MEDMTAYELLGGFVRSVISAIRFHTFCAGNHLFSTDDTSSIAECLHLLRSGVGVQRIHIASRASVADEIRASRQERAESHVDVSKDMEGQAVVEQDDSEEGEVG